MNKERSKVERRIFGWFARTLCACILVLGSSAGPLARSAGPVSQPLVFTSKGLYYGGFAYGFRAEWYYDGTSDLKLEERSNNGTVVNWTMSLTSEPIAGDLGACVFNGLLYCFFTTQGGNLEYVAVNVPTQQVTGPTTITTGIAPQGAAATVLGGTIYVLAAPSSGFSSSDGTSFATWSPQFQQGLPSQMIAAVTFYPMGDDPAGILFVYNDSSSPMKLCSCIIYPPDLTTVTNEVTLPWPPVNPYLWAPIVDGQLLLGTAGSPFSGALAPCVQFYGLTNMGDDGEQQGRWEYNLTNQTWTFDNITQQNVVLFMTAFPWFTSPDSNGVMTSFHIAEIFGTSDQFVQIQSDYMVPQNNDPTYGWAGTPTPTDDKAGTELQNLWTLVGVVLGPPPYAMNGATDACTSPEARLSWVDYGKDSSTTLSTTSTSESTITVASDSKIKGGLGNLSLDLSYAHGWTSSHGTSTTVSVSQDYQFDPCAEQIGSQGIHGWAIFNAPTLLTQWYKLYAYNYSPSSNTNTYLNQDIYTTGLGAVVQQTAYFELPNPGQGEYTGLFAGMPVYPNSTDIANWHSAVPDWSASNSNWTEIFGDTTNPQMPQLNMGEDNDVSFTQSNTNMDSKGNTNSFDVTAGAKLNILGFSEALSVGYNGEWTSTTENESTITQNVTCGLNMPIPPNNPGYVSSLTVQPYWLQANTSLAPWIPTGYSGNLPWCITWAVTQYQTEGGGTAGRAAAPDSASGTIRHGSGNQNDTYTLTGGHLAWLNADGTETPISMTADQFDPSKGATISLNGYVFSADDSKGTWSRRTRKSVVNDPSTLHYRSQQGVKTGPFTLDLDLADKTWSFNASSNDLDQSIKAGDGEVRVQLGVNGSYLFTTWLKHDIDVTWNHEEKKSAWQPSGVHQIEGAFSSKTGTGNVEIKGHIPKNVSSFGDIEIVINGASARFPLMMTEHFLDALRHHKSVAYRTNDESFNIDFATGLWTATIGGSMFTRDMAPKNGVARVQILLGGKLLSDQTFTIQNSITSLMYSS